MGYRYTKFSSIGTKRKVNQDALEIAEIDGGVLFILCDGMGGEIAGESVSELATKSIKSFFSASRDEDYLDRLKTSVSEANDYIFSVSGTKPDLKKMASTIELLFLKNNIAYIAHIGDSRIYHLKNGKLKQLTKDHSLIQKLLDEGFLTLKEAENHPERNVVLKAIGEKGFIEADLLKVKLNQYDKNKFFICSDGVSNILSDPEIEKLVKTCNCDTIVSKLPQMVRSRGAFDDFSFIYIESF